jgi:alpha-D-xyloside xylohydrolase
MNYNGEDVELAQHNMDVAIPFVVSTRNYGLLWDNNSITRFGDPDPYPSPAARRRAQHRGEDGRPAGPRPISSATARSSAPARGR